MLFTILNPCDDAEDAACLSPINELHDIAHEVVDVWFYAQLLGWLSIDTFTARVNLSMKAN